MPSSILFISPYQAGEFEFAKEFSQYLLCQDYPQGPCGFCKNCVLFTKNSLGDLYILDPPGKSIKISEHIRPLLDEVSRQPLYSSRKIFIINQAQRMTPDSSSALLKTLEEPPLFCLFILIVPNLEGILPTIVSRCWKVYFGPVPTGMFRRFLELKYGLGNSAIRTLENLCAQDVTTVKYFINEVKVSYYRKVLSTLFSSRPQAFYFKDRLEFKDALLFLLYFFRQLLVLKLGISSVSLQDYFYSKEAIILKDALSFEDLFGIIDRVYEVFSYWESININLGMQWIKEKILCLKR